MKDYYKEGRLSLDEGDWQDALNIWLEGRFELELIGEADPRIGFSFVEIVTKHELENLYNVATDIYYWGLTATETEPFTIYIREELERISPIIEESTFHHWTTLLDNDDARVLRELNAYWMEQDPAPSTNVNERLIEHWNRIHFSREHFTRNDLSVYSTDDRGTVYVKYGEPERVRRGMLKIDRFQVQGLLRDMLQLYGIDSYNMFDTTNVQSMDRNVREENYIIEWYTRLVNQAHRDPAYEVWRYGSIENSQQDKAIFIFGESADGGEFGLLNSLDEMISNSAFRHRNRLVGNLPINAGLLMQLSYYRQLAAIDDYFSSIYTNMEASLMTTTPPHRNFAREIKSQHRSRLERLHFGIPVDHSEYDDILPDFELDYKFFRFYDDDEPILILLVYSWPHQRILAESMFDGKNDDEFLLNYTVTLWDNDLNKILNSKKGSPVELVMDYRDNSFAPSVNQFVLPHLGEESTQLIHAELFQQLLPANSNENSSGVQDLKAANRVKFNQPGILERYELGEFTVSDLVVGYSSEELDDEQYRFPYYIPHDNMIPGNHDLDLTLDVYNLKQGDDQLYEFEIFYTVSEINRRGGRRLEQMESGIRLNFQSDEPSVRNHIKVDIKDYRPGVYRMTLEIQDLNNNERIIRTEEFEVVD